VKAYTIKKIATDNYELTIGDEVIKFKRDIKLLQDVQKSEANAKLDLIADLKSRGLTKDDLCVKTFENGKVIEDWTEYETLKNEYLQLAQSNMMNKMIEGLLKISMLDLIERLEATEENDIVTFMGDLIGVFNKEKTPSK